AKGNFHVGDWGTVAADGTFTVLTIPGPGVLMVCADQGHRFTILEPSAELYIKFRIPVVPFQPLNAVVTVNPSAQEPASLTCDVALEPGRRLLGRVVGPDGQPLTGVHAAGLAAPVNYTDRVSPDRERRPSQGMKDAAFTAYGLHPSHPRALVFYHPEKRLGKVECLRGDEAEPLTVRLEPLG